MDSTTLCTLFCLLLGLNYIVNVAVIYHKLDGDDCVLSLLFQTLIAGASIAVPAGLFHHGISQWLLVICFSPFFMNFFNFIFLFAAWKRAREGRIEREIDRLREKNAELKTVNENLRWESQQRGKELERIKKDFPLLDAPICPECNTVLEASPNSPILKCPICDR
jgi:hypothetical protein